MKIYKQLTGLIFVLTIISCNDHRNGSSESNSAPQYFKTQSEAIQKGKNDLLSIMRSSQFQFTIDPALLQKSQPKITVKHVEIDFNQLLKEEQVNNLNQLRNDAKSNINALMIDNNVVTIIQTVQSDKGWTVTGLADAALASDLDEVLSTQSIDQIDEITLYEIANLQAFIYQIKTTIGEMYFSKYNGATLKESTSIDQIYPVLHGDALLFERKYGDDLRYKKLLK
jgi:hypothetical protein